MEYYYSVKENINTSNYDVCCNSYKIIGGVFCVIGDVYKEYIYEIRTRNYTEITIKGYKNNLKIKLL